MPDYKILAHECIAHTYIIKADSEEQARKYLLTYGNDPDKSDTLNWEIVDIEKEEDQTILDRFLEKSDIPQ